MAQPPYINNFYRIWFTWIDPLSLLGTVIGCFLAPGAMLDALVVPAAMSPYQPLQAALIYQTGILYAFMGTMFAVLLRASPDPRVWRIVEGATLCVDLSLLVMLYWNLALQGRAETAAWRPGDWFNLVFTVWVAGIRGAFLAGIGGTAGVGVGWRKKRV